METYLWREGDDWLRSTDLDRRVVFELPAGYRRVWSGAIKPGDLCLNRCLFWADGLVDWMPLENRGIVVMGDHTFRPIRDCAELYTLVIRLGDEFNGGCERCQARKRDGGMKFCDPCGALIKEALRG